MLLGIDVGGTHTDAVILDDAQVVASAKVPTDHDHLLGSIREGMRRVISSVDPGEIHTVNLSTTLSTNSIVEGKTEDVGMLVSCGPGIDPEHFRIGGHFHVIPGSLDHRGRETASLDADALDKAVTSMRDSGIEVFASVGKFSTRNPEHERAMTHTAQESGAAFVTQGHTLSGILNFPRRLATAYFNSAVWRTYDDFAWAVSESMRDFGISANVNVLKADGGTMPLSVSRSKPVESILSGPAASVMGMIALCDIRDDCVILDIGGTTTDIAVFADGAPVAEEQGMTVGSYPTLVKALKVHSIGVGGDSTIRVDAETVRVGPQRKGPALASCTNGRQGKRKCHAALTDALNYLGYSSFGNIEASRQGIEKLAQLWDMKPQRLAEKAVEDAVSKITKTAAEIVEELNEKPVYTILELLKGKRIRPGKYYVMGGPARAVAPLIEEASGIQSRLPNHHAVANAVGAALTRTTMEVELFADTARGRMFIPALRIEREVGDSYTKQKAEQDARQALCDYLAEVGVTVSPDEAEITEANAFNMVEGMGTAGRNIRVRCQIRPGIIKRVKS